jgi:signal transduction histidine kinase
LIALFCQRETTLINDLLDLSRLEADADPLLLSTLDLSSWLAHVVIVFEEIARQRSQILTFAPSHDQCLLTTDYI